MTRKLIVALASAVLLLASLGGNVFASTFPPNPCGPASHSSYTPGPV